MDEVEQRFLKEVTQTQDGGRHERELWCMVKWDAPNFLYQDESLDHLNATTCMCQQNQSQQNVVSNCGVNHKMFGTESEHDHDEPDETLVTQESKMDPDVLSSDGVCLNPTAGR